VARQRKEESGVEIAVPITPMLDMSFQLLSFFILTFHPRPTEGQLAINLPKVDATETPIQEPLLPDDTKDSYTITVHANSNGTMGNLALKGPAVSSDNLRGLSDLLEQLKKIPKPEGRAEKVSITIESANDLNYGVLIEIMDVCKKAGYESVNLMPLRKERG
jgi:biopolymer transport protein ExbD